MRKVFISFLGTSNYIPCNYVCEDYTPVNNVRFIQEATISWYCADWKKDDELLFFTTEESHNKNWVNNGHKNKTGQVIQCEGLEHRVSLIKTSAKVSEVKIPAGKNEQEIWGIFTSVFEKIKNGDELYFDITHAFRSLPLLAMVIINYAKITKDIKVKAIGYGAMEAIGNLKQVAGMDIIKRNVPVFNLLPFDRLLDWSTAIDKFVSSGDASSIQKLTTENITPVLSKTKGQDQEAASLRKMTKYLGNFSRTLATCRGRNVVKDAANLKNAIADAQDQQLIKPLNPLLARLENATSKFSGDEVQDGIAATRWCLQHNLTQQGFTLLQETMFTYILEESTDEGRSDIKKRNLVSKAVKIQLDNTPFDNWDDAAKNYKSVIKDICFWLRPQKKLLDCMRNLTGYRNDLNHAGMNENPMAANIFNEKLKNYLDLFESIVSRYGD